MESEGEELLRLFNSNYFLKEFTFFPVERDEGNGESQFTDGFIWLRDYMIIWEFKDRNPEKTEWPPKEEVQRKWFRNKVLGIAKKQIKEDKGFFETYRNIDLKNLRGQPLKMDFDAVKDKYYVIIYNPRYPMPSECSAQKYYLTKTNIFIHLIHAYNWPFICRYLETPMEIIEYLQWRKRFLSHYKDNPKVGEKSEKWLVGRFLGSPTVPDEEYDDFNTDYEKWVDNLQNNAAEVHNFNNIAQTLASYKNRTREFNDYRKTMLYLALLNRIDRGLFVERYNLMSRKVLDRNAACVYRFTSPQNDIGFVFSFAYPDFSLEQRLNSLMHFTYAHKYEQKVQRCIGLCIYPSAENDLLVDWYFTESPWEKSSEWDNVVKDLYEQGIFLSVKKETVPRYTFEDIL